MQCDFALPKRFNLAYVDSDGKERQPIMIHRVLLGSLERFIGALLEHYKGDLPLWLAPTQVLVVPIKEAHLEYAEQCRSTLQEQGMRVDIDSGNETLNKRIRNAELNKVPYVLVVGDREASSKSVCVRKRKAGDQGSVSLGVFLEETKKKIQSRAWD